MKHVNWTDEKGWKRRSLVPDTSDESDGRYGIPAGPPDLRQLDWEHIQREINNALVDRGVFSWEDVSRTGDALMVATTIVKRHLVGLYREEQKDTVGGNTNANY